jgi:transposase
MRRRAYPGDVADEEWALVAPYLTLMTEDAPQRAHSLREVFNGLRLEVVKVPEAERGFVLLPRHWVVERSFAWAARFRRLARGYERLPKTLAGLHFPAFAILMLKRLVGAPAQSSVVAK